jgi:hypothetical protein
MNPSHGGHGENGMWTPPSRTSNSNSNNNHRGGRPEIAATHKAIIINHQEVVEVGIRPPLQSPNAASEVAKPE